MDPSSKSDFSEFGSCIAATSTSIDRSASGGRFSDIVPNSADNYNSCFHPELLPEVGSLLVVVSLVSASSSSGLSKFFKRSTKFLQKL